MSYWSVLFSTINIGMGACAMTINSVYPLIFRTGFPPYALHLRGVNFSSSPLYEITFVTEALTNCNCCIMYIPYCSFFFAFILFGIAKIRILRERLRKVAEPYDGDIMGRPDNALIAQRFRVCIELHKRLLLYVDELNGIVATVFMVEIVLFGAILCALLFVVQIVNEWNLLLMGLMQISLIITQLFILYFVSNQLIEESHELALALYDSPWYFFSNDNQRTTLLIIAQLQRPMVIMVGNVVPITLQTFQGILNMSYSYIALLRRSLMD